MKVKLSALALCGAASLLFASAPARAEDKGGTVEGTVTFAGTDAQAKPVAANVDKDQAACLKNGPINKADYVVNPKNKGVRWAVVWLVDANDINAPLPVPDSLKQPKDKEVVVDQPCCQFEPHIICLREGQTLVIKNSGTVTHNTKIDSPGDNPSVNPLIPPGQSYAVSGWKADYKPSVVGCSIHGWMGGYIRVFNHPYFAVTDEDGHYKIENAPAGNYHIVAWQESVGYIDKGLKKGDPVTIAPNPAVTTVNFEVKPK